MFTQIIVDSSKERHVEHLMNDGIHVYKFYVLNEWAGNNQDVFWARCDDDLIATMIKDAQCGKYTSRNKTQSQ